MNIRHDDLIDAALDRATKNAFSWAKPGKRSNKG